MQSATTTEMMKERLCLITAMMAKGDRRTAGLHRALLQNSLSCQAPRLFEADLLRRCQGRDIDPFAEQRDLHLRAERADKNDIIATLLSNSVIEVSGDESKLQGRGNSTEEIKEGNGIATAGQGNQDAFLRANQPVGMELP
jgi:hypothetical protein